MFHLQATLPIRNATAHTLLRGHCHSKASTSKAGCSCTTSPTLTHMCGLHSNAVAVAFFAAFPVLQQPRLRLRHLQAVALHTFSPPLPLPRHAQLLYEVSLLPAGAEQQQQQLVYVSEQVRRSSSCIAVLWFLHHCERLGQLTDFALW